ncbi:MAG: hypothetical protein ACOZBZ_02230 [Patescibacteria group bacterium]
MEKPVSLVKLLKDYSSGWVALSVDYKRVVTWGKSLKEIDLKLKRLGSPEIVLISAAQNYRGFIT